MSFFQTKNNGPQYTPLTERASKAIEKFQPSEATVNDRVQSFPSFEPRHEDKDGDTEIFDGVKFTHHLVEAPGEEETLLWHYAEAGVSDGESIVFLHGIPDSWFQWHHQMAALSHTHRCIAVDLKGYGQSDKRPGDYRHEGAAEQMFNMLLQIGVSKFNIVTHDRGTVQADFLAAKHPEHILRYARGEQHLYHFNPVLAPQGDIFMNAPYNGIMKDAKRFILWAHAATVKKPIPDAEVTRTIQEFSYPGITSAVPRYFNSSSFRAEWLARRRWLLHAWTCPVLIMQGFDSITQPRENYENIEQYMPNAKSVEVRFLSGGHFWPFESPEETNDAIRHLLSKPCV